MSNVPITIRDTNSIEYAIQQAGEEMHRNENQCRRAMLAQRTALVQQYMGDIENYLRDHGVFVPPLTSSKISSAAAAPSSTQVSRACTASEQPPRPEFGISDACGSPTSVCSSLMLSSFNVEGTTRHHTAHHLLDDASHQAHVADGGVSSNTSAAPNPSDRPLFHVPAAFTSMAQCSPPTDYTFTPGTSVEGGAGHPAFMSRSEQTRESAHIPDPRLPPPGGGGSAVDAPPGSKWNSDDFGAFVSSITESPSTGSSAYHQQTSTGLPNAAGVRPATDGRAALYTRPLSYVPTPSVAGSQQRLPAPPAPQSPLSSPAISSGQVATPNSEAAQAGQSGSPLGIREIHASGHRPTTEWAPPDKIVPCPLMWPYFSQYSSSEEVSCLPSVPILGRGMTVGEDHSIGKDEQHHSFHLLHDGRNSSMGEARLTTTHRPTPPFSRETPERRHGTLATCTGAHGKPMKPADVSFRDALLSPSAQQRNCNLSRSSQLKDELLRRVRCVMVDSLLRSSMEQGVSSTVSGGSNGTPADAGEVVQPPRFPRGTYHTNASPLEAQSALQERQLMLTIQRGPTSANVECAATTRKDTPPQGNRVLPNVRSALAVMMHRGHGNGCLAQPTMDNVHLNSPASHRYLQPVLSSPAHASAWFAPSGCSTLIVTRSVPQGQVAAKDSRTPLSTAGDIKPSVQACGQQGYHSASELIRRVHDVMP